MCVYDFVFFICLCLRELFCLCLIDCVIDLVSFLIKLVYVYDCAWFFECQALYIFVYFCLFCVCVIKLCVFVFLLLSECMFLCVCLCVCVMCVFVCLCVYEIV